MFHNYYAWIETFPPEGRRGLIRLWKLRETGNLWDSFVRSFPKGPDPQSLTYEEWSMNTSFSFCYYYYHYSYYSYYIYYNCYYYY